MQIPIPHCTPVRAYVWTMEGIKQFKGLIMDHMIDPDCPSMPFYRVLIERDSYGTDVAFVMGCDIIVR